MSVVREDKHGVYILCGGYCFRPDFPRGYRHVHASETKLGKGDKVKARHLGGSSLATVKDGQRGIDEVWFSHGFYFGQGKTSEQLYRPDYENWT